MAGIGFQLKKLFQGSGFFWNLRAYSYSAIVTIGPMLLTILLILVAKELLIAVETPYVEVERFMAATEYAFIFSQIITGGFTFVISRYVADQTFLEKEENVLSSMYGLISVCVMLGGVSAILFYARSPLPLSFKVVTYVFFIELIIIWLQSMYVSALKDYIKIVKSFLIGVGVAAVAIWLSVQVFGFKNATALFISLDLGFLVIILMFTQYIKQFFNINNHKYFKFLIYLEKYPFLFFGGLLYVFGLYGHNIVVWQGSLKISIDDTFIIAPYYDVPVFYAYLTFLPAMILFMVTVETTFYDVYKKYYHRILHSFSLQDILNAKREMFKIVSLELTFIAEVQLFVIFSSIAFGIKLLTWLGMTLEQIHIFTILVLGSLFFTLMFTIVIILLYFDDRNGAFFTTLLFAICSITITALTPNVEYLGLSVFLASFISVCFALYKLINYLNNIDYYTFCSQPIVYQEKITRTELLLRKLGHY